MPGPAAGPARGTARWWRAPLRQHSHNFTRLWTGRSSFRLKSEGRGRSAHVRNHGIFDP